MLQSLFAHFANVLNGINLFLRDSLVHPDSGLIHQIGAIIRRRICSAEFFQLKLHTCLIDKLLDSVDLRSQNEVRLRQPIHRVRPGGDLDLAPSEQDVGMMALLLGQFAHSIHES